MATRGHRQRHGPALLAEERSSCPRQGWGRLHPPAAPGAALGEVQAGALTLTNAPPPGPVPSGQGAVPHVNVETSNPGARRSAESVAATWSQGRLGPLTAVRGDAGLLAHFFFARQ